MNKTVLVIDDDDVLIKSLANGLRKSDFSVLTANSAEQGAEVLKKISVDAIVLDRMMGGQDGLSFLKQLRKSGNSTPVIMLTALSGPENAIDGLSNGANDYLAKPFQLQELVLRLKNIIKHSPITNQNLPDNIIFTDNEFFIKDKKGLQQHISKYDLMALLEVENSYTLYMAGIKGNVSVLDKLEKMRGFIKTDDAQELAEDVRIEFGQATEVVTSYSKMLKSIKETFESIINMESNRYINRLTMWNIILVVPTVIVGYYGMNVSLPFAESRFAAVGIFFVILFLLVGFAIFSWARTKRLH